MITGHFHRNGLPMPSSLDHTPLLPGSRLQAGACLSVAKKSKKQSLI